MRKQRDHMFRIRILRQRQDNYSYLIQFGQQVWCIDPAEAQPVLQLLQRERLQLVAILNSHAHADHCGANLSLQQASGCPIFGADRRIPGLTTELTTTAQDTALPFRVLFTPGHTRGDCCYLLTDGVDTPALFSGDCLFIGGCGRLFEGSAAQLYQSLQQFNTLPDHCQLYCGHDYALDNYRFASRLLPDCREIRHQLQHYEERQRQGQPSVPAQLGDERRANPFLRCHQAALAQVLGCPAAAPVEVFRRLRLAKDQA